MSLLCRKSTLFIPNIYVVVINKLPQLLFHKTTKNDSAEIEFDVIDEFTTELVHKKVKKWSNLKINNIVHNNKKNNIVVIPKCIQTIENYQHNIECMSIKDFDELVIKLYEKGDLETIKEILLQAKLWKKLPSFYVISEILVLFARNGDLESIRFIRDIYYLLNPILLEEQSHFDHFVAEATWIKGNIVEGINLFENVYNNNCFLRPKIRMSLKYLIRQGISKHSEAILQKLIQFSERLSNNYGDYSVMILIWEYCVLSEWFSDQCVALDLLRKHDKLNKLTADMLWFIVYRALHKNQIDMVYSLLEFFLQEKKKEQTYRILLALFDYKVRQKDVRGCSEIIKWIQENNMVFPSTKKQEFIFLLINECDEKKQHKNSLHKFNKLESKLLSLKF